MRVWLDDDRDPKNKFVIENYGADPSLFWVKNPGQMVQLIESGVVTFIHFDHYLGHGWESPCTGAEIAEFIEGMAFKNKIKPIDWDVHTDSSEGKKLIIRAMRSAEGHWKRHQHDHGGEA
jgi:hypothetical protein